MLKKLIFCLSLLALHLNLLSNSLPNREMIILLETIDYETIEKTLEAPNIYRHLEILHPVGIGATTISLLIALHQQAAPIIANKSLIKNVIDHQNLFKDFLTLERKALFAKYSKHNRFRGRSTLDNFTENCRRTNDLTIEVNQMLAHLIKKEANNFDQIFNQITNHPKFQGNSYHEIREAAQNDSYIKSINLEMRMLLLCSYINFDKDWDIKQVNDDIFLLIPKNYIKNLGINSAQQTSSNLQDKSKFSDLELNLGLKIDHMRTVNRNFFELSLIQSNFPQTSFLKSLEQIFLTIDDFKKNNSKSLKHIWSIHISGHGLNEELQLNILPQLYELRKLYESKLISEKTVEHNISKQIQNQNRINIENQKYIKKINKLNHEINKIEERKKLNNKRDQAMINSLSINEFRELLKFFNNKIETAFLYYFSCFSAGPHLIEPYQENGKPLLLKYTVMTGTPAENMSVQEFPFINIPPYFKKEQPSIFEPMDITQIDIAHKKLCVTTPLRFDTFFKLLRKGIHNNPKNLILLPYSLHPHVDELGKLVSTRTANIPLARLAYSDHFKPIPADNSFMILDNKNNNQNITINKDAGLVYSDYIPGKVVLNKLEKDNEIPKLISMKPGFALHVFEHIQSSSLNIKEIVNSFLTFPELGTSKIFWIKKLECISNNGARKYQDYKDIIILRNIFNSNTLDLCSDLDPLTLENCAYYSNNNQESKLTWKGPFIDNFNSKIVPSQQISHKEECLNCFPSARNYVNPILQSI